MSKSLEEIEREIAQTQAELDNVQGTETEVYARIVGYYRAVRNWNKGKRDEFNHRKTFNIEQADTTSYILSTSDKTFSYEILGQTTTESKVETTFAQQAQIFKEDHYELFTRKTCPNCPPVKAFMANVEIKGRNIDVDSEEGLAEAAEKGVFAAPTVIVYDADGKETARAHNIEELSVIFEKIAVEA